MTQPSDFYLSTAGEYGPLAQPRACWGRGRLRDALRDDYLLVDIEPPLSGQHFNLAGNDITTLILSSRYRGATLFPVAQWPTVVYVARILDPLVVSSGSFVRDQVELIAWGEIHRLRADADAHAAKYRQ